jgi:hypothetical protein
MAKLIPLGHNFEPGLRECRVPGGFCGASDFCGAGNTLAVFPASQKLASSQKVARDHRRRTLPDPSFNGGRDRPLPVKATIR